MLILIIFFIPSFLRVQAFFHNAFRIYHVYRKFIIGYMCRITVIFSTLKDESLLINIYASNNFFQQQEHLPKLHRRFVKNKWRLFDKELKTYHVRIIRQCSNFASLCNKHLLRNYKWNFRLPMSSITTVTRNNP